MQRRVGRANREGQGPTIDLGQSEEIADFPRVPPYGIGGRIGVERTCFRSTTGEHMLSDDFSDPEYEQYGTFDHFHLVSIP